ncbi:SMODS domain-containing nucleotidyltransferase [Halomonas sp. LBP4]|uniref:SMODS domain-containing nucleotidyltransferase n=1 Tax=Halomonas sp. LBP4 TaxID=2044917 RepID=UPI000D76A761|nr:nucleotidyltransferase [Halomonas sp. LBP4]PXX95466.1 nucleotidyltransferase [Halomonas sp. LBP4]
MEIPTYFSDFLSEIRLTANQRQEAKKGHETLRKRLNNDDDVRDCIISTFIQGSYRRATAVRPKGGKRSDVDVIVVTNLDAKTHTPDQVLKRFKKALEKYYPGKCEMQGRSIGIELSSVDLDVVVTSAPSEAAKQVTESAVVTNSLFLDEQTDWNNLVAIFETAAGDAREWKSSPLQIPDRETKEWQRTDPLAQIAVAAQKNQESGGHFVNVVKALKWWRVSHGELPKYPKGYPFERLITECCPDNCNSVADGITQTLETFVQKFAIDVALERVPQMPDYGVPEHDVLKRVEFKDFEKLYNVIKDFSPKARAALNEQDMSKSACMWRELLGNKFPQPPGGCNQAGNGSNGATSGFIAPGKSSDPGRKRFA